MKATKRRGTAQLGLIAAFLIFFVVVLIIANCVNSSGKAKNEGQSSPVIVSEVMTSNTGLVTDEYGEHPDYVELYNRGSEAVDVSGWALSDRETDAWTFPNNTVIEAGGYLVVWCSGKTVENTLIANFKLSAGDVLRFMDATGTVLLQKELPELRAGNTYYYDPQTETWFEKLPSPGYPNTDEGVEAYEQSITIPTDGSGAGTLTTAHNGLYITEFMAANHNTVVGPDGSFCDWVELYNSSSASLDLGGVGVSDDPAKPYKYTFAEGTSLAPGAYLVLYSTADDVEGYYCLPFGLSSNGESLVLTDANGGILDRVEFGAQQKDVSMARPYDANGAFVAGADFVATTTISPGYPNTQGGYDAWEAARYPNVGVHDIRFSEILTEGYAYTINSKGRPDDADLGSWIELYNASDQEQSLTGMALTDNIANPKKWVFPDGTSIAAKGYLIVYLEGSLPLEGQSASSVTAEQKALTLNFDIAAAGETLYLFDAAGEMTDRVEVPACRACVSYGRNDAGQWLLMETPTMGAANVQSGCTSTCEAPALSLESGLYTGTQSITITVPEGCYVTYTLDCSTPTESSTRYTAGEVITASWKAAPVDPAGTEADAEDSASKSLQRLKNAPANTVVRARAFRDGCLASDVATETYVIVDPANETEQAHSTSLKVVFLVTDPKNLTDDTIGLYLRSSSYNDTTKLGANYNQSGREWERQASFTYVNSGGSGELYEGDLMIRMFGAYSRFQREQKGFGLISRKGFGESDLNYAFFDDRPFTSYDSLVLRASAMDSSMSKIRDVLVQSLVEDAGLDLCTQAYVQTVVYLNGNYWGMYYLREKISRSFIAQHYSVTDKGSIDVLVGNGAYVSGDESAVDDWAALIQYCKDRNCSLNAEEYAYVCSKVDVDNYALYCAIEILVGNTDTGNIKWWRSSEKDNRWRFIIYDFDWAMNRNDEKEDAYTSGYRRDFFWRYFKPEGHGANAGFSTVLSRALLSNNDFCERFVNACATLYKEVFTTEKVLAKTDQLAGVIEAEMKWDMPRFGNSVSNWNKHLNNVRAFANNYGSYFLKYCQQYMNEHTSYHLGDEDMQRIFGA